MEFGILCENCHVGSMHVHSNEMGHIRATINKSIILLLHVEIMVFTELKWNVCFIIQFLRFYTELPCQRLGK